MTIVPEVEQCQARPKSIEKSILAVDHFEVMPPSYGVQGGVILLSYLNILGQIRTKMEGVSKKAIFIK